jgi:tetratricopeptide (TPR) repeat protein
MGNIYSAQKELEKSLKEFKKILEFDQQNTHAHYNLGVGYYYLKDFDNAENEWKKAIEFEIEVINREKDISTTSGNKLNYSIIVRRRKNLYLCHLALGNLYFDQQLIDKAVPELETAVEISPKEAAPHFNLAKSYKQINAIEKAIFHLEKYIYLGGEKEQEAKKLLEQLKKGSHPMMMDFNEERNRAGMGISPYFSIYLNTPHEFDKIYKGSILCG